MSPHILRKLQAFKLEQRVFYTRQGKMVWDYRNWYGNLLRLFIYIQAMERYDDEQAALVGEDGW